MVIAITRSGYIKRLPVTAYREQRRGGIGVMGMDLKDEDYIEHLFVASTHDYILFFTNVGKVYRLKVHELPLGSRQSKGRAIVNLLPFRQDEQVRAVIQTRELRGGRVPRLRDEERRRQEDEARRVQHAAQGRRDHRDQDARGRRARRRPPLLGRRRHPDGLAQGPGGPLLRGATCARWAAPPRACAGCGCAPGDEVIALDDRARRRRPARRHRERLRQAHAHLRVPAHGPRRARGEDRAADRGARASSPARASSATGYQVMLISTGGTVIRMAVEDVKRLGRATQGVTVMRLRGEDEHVSSLALVAEADEPAEGESRRRAGARAGRGRAPSRAGRAAADELDRLDAPDKLISTVFLRLPLPKRARGAIPFR